MTTIVTTFTPVGTVDPFVGPPDVIRENSYYPRALITFAIVQGDITLAGVGDDQLCRCNCELPGNFAYTFQTMTAGITAVTDNTGVSFGAPITQIENAVAPVTPTVILNTQGTGAAPTTLDDFSITKSYQWNNLPNMIWRGLRSSASTVNTQWTNPTTTTTPAFKFDFFLSVVQYDIEQVLTVGPNTPILTR